jgi:pimeloyl-ACP methyl ester carboxylesterase
MFEGAELTEIETMVVDRILLAQPAAVPELSHEIRIKPGRAVGNQGSICFLPWNMSGSLGARLGIVPDDCIAAIELPAALLYPSPSDIRQACLNLVAAGERHLAAAGAVQSVRIMSYSLGTFPAILLAARLRAPLLAVAGGDRADRLLWESPACASLRHVSLRRGISREDYASALSDLDPINWVTRLAAPSVFVFGSKDRYIPEQCRVELADHVDKAPSTTAITMSLGHVMTILASGRLSRRSAWKDRVSNGPISAFHVSAQPASRMVDEMVF